MKLWNQNRISKALTTLFIAGTIAFNATPPAEAEDFCRKIAGYDVCYRDNGDYGADRIAVWAGDHNVADMTVICTGGGGNRWEANRDSRYVSYGDLEALANRWCRDY